VSQGEALDRALAAIDAVRTRNQAVLEANQVAIARLVERSVAAGAAATRLSVLFTLAAIVLAAVAVVLTVRSISVPLRRLTEVTRAVAGGALETRVEVEAAKVPAADDFNAMVRRLDEPIVSGFVPHVSHELKTPLAATETTRLLLDEAPAADRQAASPARADAPVGPAARGDDPQPARRLAPRAGAMDDRRLALEELVVPAAAELRRGPATRRRRRGPRRAAVRRVRCIDRIVQVAEPPGQRREVLAIRLDGGPRRVLDAWRIRRRAEVAVADHGPGRQAFERFRQPADGAGPTRASGLGWRSAGRSWRRTVGRRHRGQPRRWRGDRFTLALAGFRMTEHAARWLWLPSSLAGYDCLAARRDCLARRAAAAAMSASRGGDPGAVREQALLRLATPAHAGHAGRRPRGRTACAS
jgi:HAMP domain-containing protein